MKMNERKKNKPKKAHFFEPQHFPMDFGKGVVYVPYRYLTRQKRIFMSERYKIKGGALIVANHTSFSDPIAIGAAFLNRRIFFLTGELAMSGGLRKVMLKAAGCIKIDRNISDIEAVRKATELLKEGRVLTVFPQGALVRDDDLSEIKAGAILIALRAGVPIIPVYLNKPEKKLSKRTIIIGEALNCSDYCSKGLPSMTEIDHLAGILLSRMQACKTFYEDLPGGKGE